MRSPAEREQQAYKPGQMVPISGIYTAVHADHRSQHEVVAIRGEEFPVCRICRHEVRFYVAEIVPHMTHDFDLTGPNARMFKRRAKAAGKGME